MALFLIPFHEYLLNALGVSSVWFMDETPGRESLAHTMYSTQYDWKESNKHRKKS